MPFKYVFSCLHLQIWLLCGITDLAMHWTGMLLNWIHSSFDWLCVEPLYTVQVLTEGATAWELKDQMPPLAGSNWGYHGSTTLSDAFFGWIALSLFHCWLPWPEESSLLSSMQIIPIGSYVGEHDFEPPRRTWSPMSWLAPIRPLALEWAWDSFNWDWTSLAECWLLMTGCLWWLLCPWSHDFVEPWPLSSLSRLLGECGDGW